MKMWQRLKRFLRLEGKVVSKEEERLIRWAEEYGKGRRDRRATASIAEILIHREKNESH